MDHKPASVTVVTKTTEAISQSVRRSIIDVCKEAHQDQEFEKLFDYIPSGGRHFLCYLGSKLVSHAVITTRWLQPAGLPVQKTAYVDAVATLPGYQGKGYATATMRHLAQGVTDYALACLQTERVTFYQRLGWQCWQGPLGGRADSGFIPTPQQQGVMILRLPGSPELDINAALSIEANGRIW